MWQAKSQTRCWRLIDWTLLAAESGDGKSTVVHFTQLTVEVLTALCHKRLSDRGYAGKMAP